ncbi:MAG: DUF2339 domain-containing protein [Ginsengibacter sp.]
MQEITVLLLVALIVLFINFRSYVKDYLKKIESDIQELKDTYSSTLSRPAKPVVTEEIKIVSKKIEKDYWESSFKRMDDPLTQLVEEEKEISDKTKPELVKAEPVASVVVPERKINTPPPGIKSKPGFFERNPDLEKFIGENLVSKIGIAILVLAIGFFVKFAIDNNWIGPVGRVGIGILCGGILVALAYRLRHNYKAFSSVLTGGGLAVFYFTITLAYHQFNLFSQTTSFIIMVVITVFAVALSILYDRQELAIIALVGGFAAPFLVSNGNGNYQVLFTYLLILNTGLLIIAYNKAWRLMNLLAFIFTVVLFSGWLIPLSDDSPANTFFNGFIFATCFYLLFFFINIANNIKENKKFIASDFGILLANTGLYFAAGIYFFSVMNKPEYHGLFTILIGVFNLMASYFFFRKRKVDTNILYLLIGITLTFISLTAPIQLHGRNITLFWASETVLLYWLFQKSKIKIVEYASLTVWVAMLVSLLIDWTNLYSNNIEVSIIFNKGFITGLYAALATYFLFILRNKTNAAGDKPVPGFISKKLFRYAGIVLLFLSGALEINYQFKHHFPGFDLNVLYLQLYYFAFVLLFILVNAKLSTLKMSLNSRAFLLVSCIAFYIITLPVISRLQSQLLQEQKFVGYFSACWISGLLMTIILYKLIQVEKIKSLFTLVNYEVVIWLTCTFIITFLSFELFWIVNNIFYSHQTPLEQIQNVFIKTVLPILWGLCSFSFMWLGMKYKFKPLRIISLVLFLITLLKLFIFDISNIPAGGKIAAFFCLGVLLLIVSFMYQRLKKIIIQDEEKNPA